jgi:hypothetical protein
MGLGEGFALPKPPLLFLQGDVRVLKKPRPLISNIPPQLVIGL